ncbi:MAG: hypothetical protein JSU86_01790 [Phycisphaerales bacterium]|nr:MAG: hypothetical protein JSU86_01790 [Phycisphaerales bacterium]
MGEPPKIAETVGEDPGPAPLLAETVAPTSHRADARQRLAQAAVAWAHAWAPLIGAAQICGITLRFGDQKLEVTFELNPNEATMEKLPDGDRAANP